MCYHFFMKMTTKIIIALAILGLGVTGYLLSRPGGESETNSPPGIPGQVPVSAQALESTVLSGTYVCLPLLDSSAPKNECAFGIIADSGEYYAVNFGAGAGSMSDFKDGAHVVAKGFITPKARLTPDNWKKFVSEGLFTITEKLSH